jgi:hypothetical protein
VLDAITTVPGSYDALGKWCRRDCLAVWTEAAVGAMFGHHDLRLGHIENLSGLVSGAHLRRHLKGAVRAALRIMVDDDLRILDLTQGLSSMTFLSAWFLARRLPQALGPGRLRQPVA